MSTGWIHRSVLLSGALASCISAAGLAACGGDDSATDASNAGGGEPTSTSSTKASSSSGNSQSSSGPGAGAGGAGAGGNAGGGGNTGGGGDATGAPAVRAFIDDQVGGIAHLTVPATDDALPVPPDDPARPGRYDTTPEKAYLGKMLFHDPVRTARINANTAQPLDLPVGTAFGGTVNASDPNVASIVAATKQTGSCGSCHFGEAAGKAGQQLNFNVGGEGRGYTDASGKFFPRRRAMAGLTKQRAQPLFPGDALVDSLPTLTDIYSVNGLELITTPAYFYHNDPPPAGTIVSLLKTGRLDEVDSVGRQSPTVLGFAFNNRLLFGGLGGEPHSTGGGLNPLGDPAGENLTLLLLDAHRMIGAQSAELLNIPAFVKLFEDAFPEEAAAALAANDKTLLVNDQTELRAQATFLRTMVTRDTPFDRFLAGNDAALTSSQLRGAKLFFTKAQDGGAGCFSCHSGPMLNKQPNDPDVAGIGQFVEENFVNVGIGDHPVQALNAAARSHPTAYHAEDTGRAEITGNASDVFKFRSMTLRQLKDARTFFHNGSFTRIRDVVSYFNAGIPQDPTAGAAATLDARFTGLGLTEAQVDDVTDFLENGLYDPSFLETLQPSLVDLKYSTHRPDLAALGAQDGKMLSGLAIDSNDPLARRDQGLEFLDVSPQVTIQLITSSGNEDEWLITNTSSSVIDTHLLVVLNGLATGITVDATETSNAGKPYYRMFLPSGVLDAGQSISTKVVRTGGGSSSSYTFQLMSGQGKL